LFENYKQISRFSRFNQCAFCSKRGRTLTQKEYVSVKDACKMLNCGRTKIYTHYISHGLLSVSRKVGNRSFFLKSDIENLIAQEQEPQILEALKQNSSNSALPVSIAQNEDEDGPLYLKPVREDRDKETLVTDYISNLKNRVNELEEELQEAREVITQYKSKLLNTVPLLDYNEKLKQKEEEIKEASRLLEQQKHSNKQLEQNLEQKSQEKSALEGKFSKSIEIATVLNKLLEQSETKSQQIKQLMKKLTQLRDEKGELPFWNIPAKLRVQAEIDKTMDLLEELQSSK
jgi:DNA repair exonuclease SbcCD ATPase subunit